MQAPFDSYFLLHTYGKCQLYQSMIFRAYTTFLMFLSLSKHIFNRSEQVKYNRHCNSSPLKYFIFSYFFIFIVMFFIRTIVIIEITNQTTIE